MAATAAVPDYGIDAPIHVRRWLNRGISLIVLGAAVYIMNRSNAPRAGAAVCAALAIVGAAFVAGAIVMRWSSRNAKPLLRDQMLDALPWRGDEKVLDVGCGRGLLLIGAAKRLTSGKATGVDVWNKEDLSGNTAEAAAANAKAESVIGRVRIENGDALRLSYQTASYDIVMSSLVLHNLAEAQEREKALGEMLRVLKPGGHLAILDTIYTGDYIEFVEKNGAELVKDSGRSFYWCVPTRWFIARKR